MASTAISTSNLDREIAARLGPNVIQNTKGHGSKSAMPSATLWQHHFALLILWAFCTYWNFDKAFHIDDTAHLAIAQWIAQNPLHPMLGMLFWGQIPEPIHVTNQPHLYFYAMAGWGSIFGWTEHFVYPETVPKQSLPDKWSRIPDRDVVVRRDTFSSHLISSPAGLYISTRWHLPWSCNTGEVEVFHVVRLQRKPWDNER